MYIANMCLPKVSASGLREVDENMMALEISVELASSATSTDTYRDLQDACHSMEWCIVRNGV